MIRGNPAAGLACLAEGFRLIRQPGLRAFVVIPLLINLLLFIAMIWWLGQVFAGMVAAAMAWLPDWAWLQSLDWLFWLLYGGVALLLVAYGFVVLANLVGSPFYGFLAERVEARLTGVEPPSTGWVALLRDVPRILWREVQKILYYLPRALILLLIGLIPVVNLLAALLWLLFNGWMMALQYVDYPADNHKLPFRTLRQRLAQRRLSAFGFGLPVALLAMVPVVNLVVVPAAVCGATVYWVREGVRQPAP